MGEPPLVGGSPNPCASPASLRTLGVYVDELRVTLADRDETIMRLTREGNTIVSCSRAHDGEHDYVIRFERATEIRERD